MICFGSVGAVNEEGEYVTFMTLCNKSTSVKSFYFTVPAAQQNLPSTGGNCIMDMTMSMLCNCFGDSESLKCYRSSTAEPT